MFSGLVNCYFKKTYFPKVLYHGNIGFGLLSSKRGIHTYNIYLYIPIAYYIGTCAILISIWANEPKLVYECSYNLWNACETQFSYLAIRHFDLPSRVSKSFLVRLFSFHSWFDLSVSNRNWLWSQWYFRVLHYEVYTASLHDSASSVLVVSTFCSWTRF